MLETTVRKATSADCDTIARFNAAMALETENKTLDAAVIGAGVQRFVSDAQLGFYLVAERDGALVGCLGITYEWSDWRNGLFWWIQSVYVEPGARRSGVFRHLYDHVSAMASKMPDVCGLRLYVEKENTRAQQTYANLGMEETDYRLFEVCYTS